jgi:hypothetical protein
VYVCAWVPGCVGARVRGCARLSGLQSNRLSRYYSPRSPPTASFVPCEIIVRCNFDVLARLLISPDAPAVPPLEDRLPRTFRTFRTFRIFRTRAASDLPILRDYHSVYLFITGLLSSSLFHYPSHSLATPIQAILGTISDDRLFKILKLSANYDVRLYLIRLLSLARINSRIEAYKYRANLITKFRTEKNGNSTILIALISLVCGIKSLLLMKEKTHTHTHTHMKEKQKTIRTQVYFFAFQISLLIIINLQHCLYIHDENRFFIYIYY